MDARLTKYNQDYSRKYQSKVRIILQVLKVFAAANPQFPEAFCPEASMTIALTVPNMMPVLGNVGMGERALGHIWCFDLEAKCHIDLTYQQFAHLSKFRAPFLAVPSSDNNTLHELQYALADLGGFNRTFSQDTYKNYGNFSKFGFYTNGIFKSFNTIMKSDTVLRQLLKSIPLYKSLTATTATVR